MAISNALSQAILNQQAPDIVGSFKAGREESRQRQIRELSGKALQQGATGEALSELQGLDPEIGFAIADKIGARSEKDISDFIQSARVGAGMLESGDTEGFLRFANQRVAILRAQGRDTTQTDMMIDKVNAGDSAGVINELNQFTATIRGAKTASQRDFESLTEGLTPEEKAKAQRIKLGLEGRARERLTAEEEAERERLKAAGKAKGKTTEERAQFAIDSGIVAADSTANIRRAVSLLNEVKTGGVDSISLRARQLFGVEGADEGELSNRLGTAVLSQLKATFGAAFTAQEGERLERLSAGFSKSPEANRRILTQALKIAERSANRGIKAARARGDEEAAAQIEEALKFSLNLDDAADAPITTEQQATAPQTSGRFTIRVKQ